MSEQMKNRGGVVRLIKDWTLPLSMLIGTVVYLVFAWVPWLDGAAAFFAPLMDALLPVFMFLVLFVTFCKVDFRRLRPVGWHAWVLLASLLFVALLMATILVIKRHGNMTGHSGSAMVLLEAVLMCVICPCATAAAVVTQKLGGSLEQTTTYTFLSNIATALLVPLCFPLVEPQGDASFGGAFGKILWQVVTLLLLPMLLAWVVKHRLHRLHRRILAIPSLSFYLWACSLMIVTGTTVKNILHAEASAWLIIAIAILVLVVCVVQFAVGRYIGHFFGRTQEGGQALGQKNTAFAIWMAYTYMNPLSSVGPGCYILWQNIVNSVEIWAARRQA